MDARLAFDARLIATCVGRCIAGPLFISVTRWSLFTTVRRRDQLSGHCGGGDGGDGRDGDGGDGGDGGGGGGDGDDDGGGGT